MERLNEKMQLWANGFRRCVARVKKAIFKMLPPPPEKNKK